MTVTPPPGWDPDFAVAGPTWEPRPDDLKQAAVDMAVGVLWALSGRQFGLTDTHLAPSVPAPRPSGYQERHRGGVYGWVNPMPWAPCLDGGREVLLPGRVVEVLEVTLDGETFTGWRLDAGSRLVRTDGGVWPVGQDVLVPLWTVRYRHGVEAPAGGNVAAGRYAGELAKQMAGDPEARVSGRVRDYSRAGVSAGMIGPEEAVNAGLTGIPQVDAWVRSVNPQRLTQPPAVWSPDTAGHRVLA